MSKNNLLKTISFIDLPGHDKVVKWCSNWDKSVIYFNVLIGAILVTISATYFYKSNVIIIGLFSAPLIFLSHWMGNKLTYILNNHEESLQKILTGVFAICGMIIGAAMHKVSFGEMLTWGLIGVIVGGIAGFIVSFIAKIFGLILGLALLIPVLPGEIIGTPIRALIAKIIYLKICKSFPEWKDIIVLNSNGFFQLRKNDSRHFVADPGMRRDGKASKMGIPMFTLAELKPEIISQRFKLANLIAGAGAGAVGAGTMLYSDTEWLNNNLAIDTGMELSSNPIEMEAINPASGLPTIAGVGTPDIGGNNWGDSSHT